MSQEFDASVVMRMIDAHEDRIQRLESVTSELASSVAEQNATMQAFSVQMKMMSESVCEKLEDVSSRLSDKMSQIAEISKETVQEIKQHDERIKELRVETSKDIEKKQLFKSINKEFVVKIVVAISVGVLGFLGHAGMEIVQTHWK